MLSIAARLALLAVASVLSLGLADRRQRSLSPPPRPSFVEGPGLTVNPTGAVPLSALVTFETDVPVEAEVRVVEPSREWLVVGDGPASRQSIPILGVRPDTVHELELTVRTEGGGERVAMLTFATPPLPQGFPPIEVLVADPNRMEPGITFFAARFGDADGTPGAILLMLDQEGQVIWFYDNPRVRPLDVECLRNGNFLVLTEDWTAFELTVMGAVVEEWVAAGQLGGSEVPDRRETFLDAPVLVDVDSFHHELQELPAGEAADFLALSSELRVLDDYPVDEVDPSVREDGVRVVGDVIVEFKRDGTVVRELSLLDVFDPRRLVYGSTAGFWNPLYGEPTFDWSHGNSVILDPADDTYIVSLRHQDAVAKIDRSTGDLVWVLGAAPRWKAPWKSYLLEPRGSGFEWPFHQHAPELDGEGDLILFDNGNYRAIPPNPPMPEEEWYSRAVEFRIDEEDRSVREVWEYSGRVPVAPGPAPRRGLGPSPLLWNSWFLGDADPLPATGNVLVTDGGKREGDRNFARIVEVTRTDPPEIVFEVQIEDSTRAVGWAVYRSERVSDLR
jgi:hypothetical protein